MKRLNHRTKAVILSAVMAVLFIVIYISGILIPEDAITGSFINAKCAPCPEHLFGTDALGRDLFFTYIERPVCKYYGWSGGIHN